MRIFFAVILIFIGFSSACVVFDFGDEEIETSQRIMMFFMGCAFLAGGSSMLGVPIYNRLVDVRNRCDMVLANIDVLIERRYDLLENILQVAKSYAKHENSSLIKIAAHRSRAGSPLSEESGKSFSPQVLAVAEAYPQLQADQTFRELSKEMRDTEDKLADSRTDYNAAVLDFNNQIGALPDVFIAKLMGLQKRMFFQVESKKRAVPKFRKSRKRI